MHPVALVLIILLVLWAVGGAIAISPWALLLIVLAVLVAEVGRRRGGRYPW